MAASATKKLGVKTETSVCPKCGKKTHGAFSKEDKERKCIHCNLEYSIDSKTAVAKTANRKEIEEMATTKKKTTKKKAAAKKTSKKKVAKKKVAKKTTKKKVAKKTTKKKVAKKTSKKKVTTKPSNGDAAPRKTNALGLTPGVRSNAVEGIFSDTPGGLMQKMILDGATNDEVWKAVVKRYDLPDSKRGGVSWSRHYLSKRLGIKVPKV